MALSSFSSTLVCPFGSITTFQSDFIALTFNGLPITYVTYAICSEHSTPKSYGVCVRCMCILHLHQHLDTPVSPLDMI
ncbi:unnamed protein product [Brachionus calyciflorus]|uniref:Uncharacterized protein n=1 Tax=Brachionus calyciflorus TaxID=104777 RepID=A0A814QSX0_9BILA|nr:unnamed protein product [Brachionus calyciflorus]